MVNPETMVALAQRHVTEAEARIARQRELIQELERDGHKSMAGRAQKVLSVLEESLRLARIHLQLEIEHYGTGDKRS